MPAIESTAVVLLAVVTMTVSSLAAALLPDASFASATTSTGNVVRDLAEAANTVTVQVSVMDNGKLMSFCIAGALGGGLISVCLFPLPNAKAMAAKFIVSCVAAVLWAPMVAHYLGWLTTDKLLAISGGVSVTSWSVLQAVIPLGGQMARWFAVRRVAAYLPPDDQPPS